MQTTNSRPIPTSADFTPWGESVGAMMDIIRDRIVEAANILDGTAGSRNIDVTNITLENDITVEDAGNVILATTTGTKIGTATTQKLGFFNVTPIVQRSSASGAAVAAATTSVATTASLEVQTNALTVLANELRTALVNFGLHKGAA